MWMSAFVWMSALAPVWRAGNAAALMWMSDLALVWRAGIAAAGSLGKRKKFGLRQVEDKRKEWRRKEREKNYLNKEGKEETNTSGEKKWKGVGTSVSSQALLISLLVRQGAERLFECAKFSAGRINYFKVERILRTLSFAMLHGSRVIRICLQLCLGTTKSLCVSSKRSRVLSNSYSSLRPPLRAEVVSLLSTISCPR